MGLRLKSLLMATFASAWAVALSGALVVTGAPATASAAGGCATVTSGGSTTTYCATGSYTDKCGTSFDVIDAPDGSGYDIELSGGGTTFITRNFTDTTC